MSPPPLTTQNIVFIQDDVPPLKAGTYQLTATQTVPNQTPGTFTAESEFMVQGERFSFKGKEIQSVFPPNLANGSFDGVFPHVVMNRRTLPWERSLKDGDPVLESSPWLAVLLFDDAVSPTPQNLTVNDLIPVGTQSGTLPANTLSYGIDTLLPLGFGEALTDPCTVIDIPIAVFNQIAPSQNDPQFLAHIREVDASDGVDSTVSTQQYAVVVGNRIPSLTSTSHAFLVSLENMADFLPADDGTQSAQIQAGIQFVRLLTYVNWSFTANDMDETLENLLENLNTPAPGQTLITTLQLPIVGTAPSTTQVEAALAEQASGQLSASGATVLAQNALLMGYIPFDHHLRHGGQTFSWYRGPLAPYEVAITTTTPISDPDAANNYNPETGLFEVSYGMAWQLGQLLALQNSGMANDLYLWKRSVTQQQAIAAEQALLKEMLPSTPLLESFLGPRAKAVASGPPPLPKSVADWFGSLATLQGIPFNYLVPDEGLLPPESIRFFYLDLNWMDALFDGAFSIGRSTTGEDALETVQVPVVRKLARNAMRQRRPNFSTALDHPDGPITGFLMRSQAVAGWPNLRIKGFKDIQNGTPTNEVKKLRVATLSSDVLLCLFDDVVEVVLFREPPEQLHLGIEGTSGAYFTTLRELSGSNPGQQYTSDPNGKPSPCDPTGTLPVACISLRTDGQTVQVADSATAIQTKLTTDFGQTFPQGFTSAEYAVEMTKGVVEVEFSNTLNSEVVTT